MRAHTQTHARARTHAHTRAHTHARTQELIARAGGGRYLHEGYRFHTMLPNDDAALLLTGRAAVCVATGARYGDVRWRVVLTGSYARRCALGGGGSALTPPPHDCCADVVSVVATDATVAVRSHRTAPAGGGATGKLRPRPRDDGPHRCVCVCVCLCVYVCGYVCVCAQPASRRGSRSMSTSSCAWTRRTRSGSRGACARRWLRRRPPRQRTCATAFRRRDRRRRRACGEHGARVRI